MTFIHPSSDSVNIPKPSLIQQFSIFEKNGGKIEEFCMIAGIDNTQQLMYVTAVRIGNSIGFRQQTIKKSPEVMTQVQGIQDKISRTLSVLSGLKRVSVRVYETEEDLGINFIGNH